MAGLTGLGIFQEGFGCPALLLEFGEISGFIAAKDNPSPISRTSFKIDLVSI